MCFSLFAVPVYDGRCAGTDTAFECDPNQLHELAIASYPLYQTGVVDLPPGSAVTVGYTAHTYPTQRHYRNITTCVSLNAAFVVLLALPVAAALACPPLTPHSLYSPAANTFAARYPTGTASVSSYRSATDVVYYEDLF